MNVEWRAILYSLGFLASLAFGLRFLIQWMTSERLKKSVVPPLFWKLSLAGNLLLLIHSFIQMQFHVFIIQSCNAVISWRNLNLMQPPAKQAAFSTVLKILFLFVILNLSLFFLQFAWIKSLPFSLFRIPANSWNGPNGGEISMVWHLAGFAGLLLFNSRFWVQWWGAEKNHQSYLGPAFWWLSLIGDLLCLLYFARIGDPVNLLGPLLGLVPYIRNLMLIRRSLKSASQDPAHAKPLALESTP